MSFTKNVLRLSKSNNEFGILAPPTGVSTQRLINPLLSSRVPHLEQQVPKLEFGHVQSVVNKEEASKFILAAVKNQSERVKVIHVNY